MKILRVCRGIVAHGDKSPVYVYEARLRGLKAEPAQAGFVNVERHFNAGRSIYELTLRRIRPVGGLLAVLLLVGGGCRAMHPVAADPPQKAQNTAATQTDLPGAITGNGWRIHWRMRDPAHPNRSLRVLDAEARSGELADQDDTETVLLHEVHARLYREGKPAAVIEAPQVTANQRDGILIGTNGVTLHSLVDPPNTIVTADTITWNTHTGAIEGTGNTHTVQLNPDGTIRNEQQGGRVTYDFKQKMFNND